MDVTALKAEGCIQISKVEFNDQLDLILAIQVHRLWIYIQASSDYPVTMEDNESALVEPVCLEMDY